MENVQNRATTAEEVAVAENRIPVYSYKNPHSHSFFLSLFLRAGSMYESEEEC